MLLSTLELLSILLIALVLGVFWGPWVALSRSMKALDPGTFLIVTRRMSANLGPLMTALMPATLLSLLPVLYLTWRSRPHSFYCFLAGFCCLLLTLLVTVVVEVPIVKQMERWTVKTLPADWQELRDRWCAFHLLRVIPAFLALALCVAGVLV